jgi:outer membrane lipoprotein-sorting protein
MKKLIIFTILLSGFFTAYSQEDLISAKDLLQKFSDMFKTGVKDYIADVKMTQEGDTFKGVLYFKNPQKLRINFTEPKRQVICTNGYMLWVYLEYLNILLKQELMFKEKMRTEEGQLQNVINPVMLNVIGYDKLVSDYSVEYNETKSKSEYKDGTKVYKLKLIRWKTTTGINTIFLTVQDNGLIRKVEGITSVYRKVTIELDNIRVNSGVGDNRFEYDAPAHANTIENFITNQGAE